MSPPSLALSYVLTRLLHLTKPNLFLHGLQLIHQNSGPAVPENSSPVARFAYTPLYKKI